MSKTEDVLIRAANSGLFPKLQPIGEGFDLEIKPVDFSELLPMERCAKREKTIAFKPTQKTVWLGGFIEGEIVSCFGVIVVREEPLRLRMKTAFVYKEWRGLGIGSALLDSVIKLCLDVGAQEIEIITISPELFAYLGFTRMPGKSEYHWEWKPNGQSLQRIQ